MEETYGPRGVKELSDTDLLEEFQSAIWSDAINEADEMSSRTKELKEEILSRMAASRSG